MKPFRIPAIVLATLALAVGPSAAFADESTSTDATPDPTVTSSADDATPSPKPVVFPFTGISACTSDFGFSDHTVNAGGGTVDPDALWHGDVENWNVVWESTEDWETTNGVIPGKAVIQAVVWDKATAFPAFDWAAAGIPQTDAPQTFTYWLHLVPTNYTEFAPVVGQPYPVDSYTTRAWCKTTVTIPARTTPTPTPSSPTPTGSATQTSATPAQTATASTGTTAVGVTKKSSRGPAALAVTGSDSGALVGLSALLAFAGASALLLRRRR